MTDDAKAYYQVRMKHPQVSEADWDTIHRYHANHDLLDRLDALRTATQAEVKRLLDGAPVNDASWCKAVHILHKFGDELRHEHDYTMSYERQEGYMVYQEYTRFASDRTVVVFVKFERHGLVWRMVW